jgi:hypothetical protein
MNRAGTSKPAGPLLALLVCVVLCAPLSAQGAEAPEPFSLTLDIINDNTPFLYSHDGVLDLGFGLGGPDDAFTNGLRLEGAYLEPLWIVHRLRVQLLLNSFTWRMHTTDSGYRMDFLSLLMWAEHDIRPFTFSIALGAVGRGNYGGAAVQNAFHELIGYIPFTMPYIGASDCRAGPVFGLQVRAGGGLFQALGFSVDGGLFARGFWDPVSAGRSTLWLGGDTRVESGVLTLFLGTGYRLSGNGGDAVLTPVFSGGAWLLTRLDVRIGDVTVGYSVMLDAYGSAPAVGAEASRFNNYHLVWSVSYGDRSRADPLDVFMP